MTDFAPTQAEPEHNLAAETAVLGAMLRDRDAVNTARLELTAAAFYRPWHGELFALICDLEDAGHRADAQLVVTTMLARKLLRDSAHGLAIFDMFATSYAEWNVAYHAHLVRTAARVRAIDAEHTRLGQRIAEARESGDTDALLTAVAEQSIAMELLADEPDTQAPVEGLATWEDFVNRHDGGQRWVVDGMIGRHDMILILAAPGAGKSFLSRLVCTSLAAGLHPFTLERIDPIRTLLVDLENAPGQVANEAAPILGQVQRLAGLEVGDRGWVWSRPEGINLRRREDAALFERVIRDKEPQLVAFGSLYNAYQRGSDGWDVAAEDVQAVLKRLRSRYDLAFWVEHHMVRAQGGAGHTGTPFGGTAWERWPTHGRVLRRATDKAHLYLLEKGTFRGDRGERPGIPVAVQRGGKVGLTAVFDEAELELIMENYR